MNAKQMRKRLKKYFGYKQSFPSGLTDEQLWAVFEGLGCANELIECTVCADWIAQMQDRFPSLTFEESIQQLDMRGEKLQSAGLSEVSGEQLEIMVIMADCIDQLRAQTGAQE